MGWYVETALCPMDLKSLRCFETKAKHGSLTRASIELGISDSAVSQRVRSLENHLGVKRYPQIVGAIDGKEENRIRQGLQRLDLPYNVALEVGNIETVKYYVARGHGIAVVSGVCISQEDGVKFHKIEIPEAFDGETAYGVIILRNGKHISSALRDLLNLLEVSNLDSKENT